MISYPLNQHKFFYLIILIQHCRKEQMTKRLLISFFILTGLFSNTVGFAQTTNNQIIQGPFKTSLYPEGKIYFQKTNDFENPINFIVDYNVDGKNKKYIIDSYPHAGADPEIRSVFLELFIINSIFLL